MKGKKLNSQCTGCGIIKHFCLTLLFFPFMVCVIFWANRHLRLWIFPQVVRLLVVQDILCVGEGELKTGVCGRSHGCVTSKSLKGCLLEDLGALEKGFAHIPWEILKCHGNNY